MPTRAVPPKASAKTVQRAVARLHREVAANRKETMFAVERKSDRRGWRDLGQWFRTEERARAYIAEWKDPERMRVVSKEVGPSVGGFTVRF